MSTRYVAFGLELQTSFPLPGMTPEETEGLPTLVLDLSTAAELAASWTGPAGSPAWRGRLGDGRSLTIERGSGGDVLFTYEDRARFHLQADARRLSCAPSHAGLDWQRALLGKIVPSVSVMRGYEALHAAVVDYSDGVVAIAGPSGAGKSSLAVELVSRGWPLFSDDELTLGKRGDGVQAHPGTPHMNLALEAIGEWDSQDVGTVLGVLAGERWLSAHRRTNRTRPVRMICVLERGPGFTLAARRLPANPLVLTPYMLGLSTSATRQRSRFILYSDLVQQATLVRLTGGPHCTPANIADLVERVLAQPMGADAIS